MAHWAHVDASVIEEREQHSPASHRDAFEDIGCGLAARTASAAEKPAKVTVEPSILDITSLDAGSQSESRASGEESSIIPAMPQSQSSFLGRAPQPLANKGERQGWSFDRTFIPGPRTNNASIEPWPIAPLPR
jgi:hypothetical protein